MISHCKNTSSVYFSQYQIRAIFSLWSQVNNIHSLSINFCKSKIILLPFVSFRFVNIQIYFTLFFLKLDSKVKCWLKFQDWSSLYFNKYSLPRHIYIYIWCSLYIYVCVADNLEEESYGKISCIAKDVALFVVTPFAVAENW